MQLDLFSIVILSFTGFIAGGINTVAGGGSNLTLPALMMFGLPADIANGTNRVAILMQSIVGVAGYDKHDTLDRPAIIPILIPTVIGGIIGAVVAAVIPNSFLKPILLGTILTMSVIILIKPDFIAPPPRTSRGLVGPIRSRAIWRLYSSRSWIHPVSCTFWRSTLRLNKSQCFKNGLRFSIHGSSSRDIHRIRSSVVGSGNYSCNRIYGRRSLSSKGSR